MSEYINIQKNNSIIHISNLRVKANIGTTEKERRKKQSLFISLFIYPLNYPPETDDIEKAINYSDIRIDIIKIVKEESYNLIETLAKKIAKHIKNKYNNVDGVRVVVKKFPYRDTEFVAYEITM